MPLTPDSTVSAVIAEYMRTAGQGAAVRQVRAALSHVDAELGTMPVRFVRQRHIAALLDDLETAGLSPRRERAVVDALEALFAFAAQRGLVDGNPVPPRGPTPARTPTAPPPPVATPPPATAPTPTLTMLTLGFRVAFWTAWIILVVFLVLLIALIVELG
jgi:hypothetical protein